jgi:hypothetical protein
MTVYKALHGDVFDDAAAATMSLLYEYKASRICICKNESCKLRGRLVLVMQRRSIKIVAFSSPRMSRNSVVAAVAAAGHRIEVTTETGRAPQIYT